MLLAYDGYDNRDNYLCDCPTMFNVYFIELLPLS